MTNQPHTTLKLVEIQGPPSSPSPGAEPFWRIVASVPRFGLKVADGPAVQEDRIHPIRTLLLGEEESGPGGSRWRTPRLLSLHIVMGPDDKDNVFDEAENLSLHVARPGGRPGPSADIIAFTPEGPPPTGTHLPGPPAVRRAKTVAVGGTSNARCFHHIVAAPILDGREWPAHNGEIDVPPLRLVEGAIELLVDKEELRKFAPFQKIKDEAFSPRDRKKSVRIRLTPDGIEISANTPFPREDEHQANLLAVPGPADGIVFRLLPKQEESHWIDAWRKLTPGGDTQEEILAGFKIDARRDDRPPAFEWRPRVGDSVSSLEGEVFIPGADLGVRLVSPSGDGIDGVATFSPTYYRLATGRAAGISPIAGTIGPGQLLLSAEVERERTQTTVDALADPPGDAALKAGMRLSSAASGSLLPFEARLVPASGASGVDHRCGYDDVVLAATLRAAQGAPEPRAAKAGDPGEKPPPLSGYIPLDEGWLQFPILNRPLPDPGKDSDMVNLSGTAPPNVLSGFLRFSQMGGRPDLLSAVESPSAGTIELGEAPWSVTVLGAEAARIEIVLQPGGATGPLWKAAAHLAQPRLSTRGLIWLSSDRPDAREALPRLSAGPTAFVDIALETKGARRDGLAISLRGLAIQSGKTARSLVRTALAVSIAPGSDQPGGGAWPDLAGKAAPLLWARHPHMPLATTMPMTRSARSSAYPLESRDLVPFLIVPDATWFLLSWKAGKAFPAAGNTAAKPLTLRTLANETWPWPIPDKPAPEPNRDRGFKGVGLIAFGVPGWELRFEDNLTAPDIWSKLRSSLRFDIPGQDEAFASATTPPAAGEAPVPVTIATSLHWDGLIAHWHDQDRRVSIARVVASRADGMADDAILAPKTPALRVPAAAVTTLIGDATWNTNLGFVAPDGSEELPYGAATIGTRTYQGDEALLGLSGPITVSLASGGTQTYEMTGFSPSMKPEFQWQVDNRRLGLKPMLQSGTLRWRPIRSVKTATKAITGLASLERPIAVSWRADEAAAFCFWMKDIGFDENGVATVPGKAADFDAWQDRRLPLGAAEWRLYPADPLYRAERFKQGRDRIRFFGMELEPLQLKRVTAKITAGSQTDLGTVVIRCRVHLGPDTAAAPDGDTIVNLVLTNGDHGWHATIEATLLRFFLPDIPGKAMLRLDARLSLAAGGAPVFADATVQLSTGALVLGGGANVTANGTDIAISFVPRAHPAEAPLSAGTASIALLSLDATVTDKDPLDLAYTRRLTIAPAPADRAPGRAAPAFTAVLDNRDMSAAWLLGVPIDIAEATMEEHDGAIGLSLKGAMKGVFSSLLEGDVSLGLAAAVPDPETDARDTVALEVGVLDGSFVCGEPEQAVDPAPHGLAVRQFWLHAESATAGPAGWTGKLELFGSIDLHNAIAWPVLAGPLDMTIPYGVGKNGRLKILVDTHAEARSHRVRYTLDGHGLDLALASRIARLDDDAVWTMIAVGEHELGDGARSWKMVAAETIAIGSATALISPVATYTTTDAKSFAGRYRDRIRPDGEEDDGNRAPGMDASGIGRIATVFRGALGRPFRMAFHDAPETGLFIAGGFAGTVEQDGGAPDLVRLPVLAGLTPGTRFSHGRIAQRGDARVDVAWSDGHAQLPVHAAGRLAMTPASWSQRALQAAMIAGSVTRWSRLPAVGAMSMAVLVEQYFSSAPMGSDDLKKGDLDKTPFFIASAVTVERLLKRATDKPIRITSFLAAALEVKAQDASPPTRIASLAGAITVSSLGKAAGPLPEQASLLFTIGDTLVESAWQGDGGIAPFAVAIETIHRPAFIAHAAPRVALLRLKGSHGLTRYRAVGISGRIVRSRRNRIAEPVLPDAARGFPLAVAAPGGWLYGTEESISVPVRDDQAHGDLPPSGAAGLARDVGLPAEAARRSSKLGDPVWYVQTRAPTYYPLDLTGIVSEAIPWLRPVTARPRVPTVDALTEAWTDANVTEMQAIIPEGASITSAGDRAGVLTVRATHLEAPITIEDVEFDTAAHRFGRPAQAGPFLPRTDRSPRPGPLPTNGDQPYRRRRPCASPLLNTVPLALIRGTADTLRGEEDGGWAATFVAASAWNGIVTDKWDGTIELSIEVDVAKASSATPAQLLGKLLKAEGGKLGISARLLIGGTAIDYRFATLRGQAARAWLDADGIERADDSHGEAPEGTVAARQRFSIWLDPSVGGDRHEAVDAIGKAMTMGETLPLVALTVAVQAPAAGGELKAKERYPIEVRAPNAGGALPGGETAPPTTLRFELFPLIPQRGALPLAPASAIFVDQSYDDSLSSVPLSEPTKAVATPLAALPQGRGELRFILSAERARAQLGGTLALMLDLAFERRLDTPARKPGDGDLALEGEVYAALTLAVQPADGEQRPLLVGTPVQSDGTAYTPPTQPTLRLGYVHELDLSRLVEANGRAAEIRDGDMLVLSAALIHEGPALPSLWLSPTDTVQLTSLDMPTASSLRVQLTAAPVVEPPPASYVAIMRRILPDPTETRLVKQLSLPLYAQSPYPRRVGMIDARAGFRMGLIRRYATFVWTLMRPRAELDDAGGLRVHVVKEERSGQSHRPDRIDEFVAPRSIDL